MPEDVVPIPPVKQITVSKDNLRVVLFLKDGVEFNPADKPLVEARIEDWLDNGGPLVLAGVERMELYEIVDKPTCHTVEVTPKVGWDDPPVIYKDILDWEKDTNGATE